jgi:molecular chaperone HscC
LALSHPAQSAALFKRAMGTERGYSLGASTYTAPELSAMILQSLKADAQAHLGVPVTDVVISVPAYFNELQRKAVRAAGRIAGLNVTRLINEPTAAALAYGMQEQGEARILVIDLGGGTFDVSLLDLFDGVMEVRATAGDAFLGGEDFTEALARHIATHHALDPNDPALRPGLLTLAEDAKRALSTQTSAQITAQVADHRLNMSLTRDRFDDITAQLMTRLAAPLDRILSDTSIRPEQISKVVLVGGATRMPALRAWASRKLRAFPTMGMDPDHVVALGAAVQSALVAGDRALDDIVMTDVAAFTLGVDTVHRVGTGWRDGYFAPIIERNSVVPTSREQIFQTVQLGQEQIRFGIYQGESPLVMHNLALGQIEVPVPRNKTAHESARVRFTYDVSGLLEVEVTVQSTGHKAQLVIQQLAGDMSEADITAAIAKMDTLKIHPRDEAANIHLRARIEAAYAMARADARDWVTSLLLQFDTAVEAQDKPALATLRPQIHAALDAFEAGHVT